MARKQNKKKHNSSFIDKGCNNPINPPQEFNIYSICPEYMEKLNQRICNNLLDKFLVEFEQESLKDSKEEKFRKWNEMIAKLNKVVVPKKTKLSKKKTRVSVLPTVDSPLKTTLMEIRKEWIQKLRIKELKKKATTRTSGRVIILLDRSISDQRITKIYSDISREIVANNNYKYFLLNVLEHGYRGYHDWSKVPREYLADEYFIRKLISFGSSFYGILQYISYSIWNNQRLIISFLKKTRGDCFSSFPNDMKNHQTFAEVAVKMDPKNMRYTNLNSKPVFVRMMAKENVKCLPYIDHQLLFDQKFMVSLMLELNIKNTDLFGKKYRYN